MGTSSPNDPQPVLAPGAAAPVRALRLLNDEPVDNGSADLLGARTAAVRLAALLRASHRSTPFTLVVDAGWGMGKSSLMRLIDSELNGQPVPDQDGPEVRTIWYNAWTSSGGDALEGLIKSVLASFDRNVLRRAVREVSEHRSAVRALRALTVLVTKPLGISRMIDEWWAVMNADPKARNEMRAALCDIVKEWSGATSRQPGRRMLVVFIDDLDRCTEATVLAVCEALKVYLDVPGVAFVIGCDRTALGPGGLLRELGPAGTAFMEKIFQTSYRVQGGSTHDIRGYVHHCARQAGIDDLLDDTLADILAALAARNPRRIKRLVNGVLLGAKLNPTLADTDPEAVIRTILLQYLYPDFFRLMTSPGQDAVREFRAYVQVWQVLRAHTPPTEAQTGLVHRFSADHRLPEQPVQSADQRLALLADLEQQLPTPFPKLIADHSFTTLLNDLLALPDSEELLRRLQEGVDTWDPELDRTPDTPTPAPARGGGHTICCLADARLNRLVDRRLSPHGYLVLRSTTLRQADQTLNRSSQPPDLLICALDFEGVDETGFHYLAQLRSAHRYDGPAIFLTDRITPARETRAEELGAVLLSDPQTLLLDRTRQVLGTTDDTEKAWSSAANKKGKYDYITAYMGPGI